MNKLLREKKAAAVCFLILGLCAFFSCNIWNLSVPEYIEDQLNRGKDNGPGGSGPGLPLPPGPRIIAAVPGTVPGDFTLYWYIEANPDFGEAMSMKVSGGSSSTGDILKAGWTGGGADASDPYVTGIQLGNSVSIVSPLTLTVFNAEGEESSITENPAELTELLPVYVGENAVFAGGGILPSSPTGLVTAFTTILGRYSKIKMIVTETINYADTYSIAINKTVVIEPWENGGSVIINKNGQGSIFSVGVNAGLTIQGKNGNTIEFNGLSSAGGDTMNNNNPLFVVNQGSLTMNDGASITGNNNSGNTNGGGGVYVGAGGRFTMTGGTIQGNSAERGGGVFVDSGGTTSFVMNGGTILENNASDGGGVYIFPVVDGADDSDIDFTMTGGEINGNIAEKNGGGVYLNSSQFAMQGGYILGNVSEGGDVDMGGGGVAVVGAAFEMTGGSIGKNADGNRNTAINGGGVFVMNGTFEMTGGTIEGNIAKDPSSSGNNEGHGGGVYLFKMNAPSAAFTMMNGSSIKNNTAVNGNGGGVYIAQNFDFKMGGGNAIDTISGNTANSGGGVALINNGTFTMNGGIISGNTAKGIGGGEGGGGVYINSDGSIINFIMKDGEIKENTALSEIDGASGGGVLLNGGQFELSNGTLIDNEAPNGGGVAVIGGLFAFGTVAGDSPLITENEAIKFGGGVYISNGGGTFSMGNDTASLPGPSITSNTADLGGGVYNGGIHEFIFYGGTISGNTATADQGNGIYGTVSRQDSSDSGIITDNIYP